MAAINLLSRWELGEMKNVGEAWLISTWKIERGEEQVIFASLDVSQECFELRSLRWRRYISALFLPLLIIAIAKTEQPTRCFQK